MNTIKKTDIEIASPIKLDPAQLDELDRLIDSLKKEIIHPRTQNERESSATR